MADTVQAILFHYWLPAFAFTLIIEAPFYVLIGKGGLPEGAHLSIPRLALAGAAGTCLTHPLLWFVWPRVVSGDYSLYVISGELLVSVVEAGLFFALARPVRLSRAVAASFIANAVSYGGGLALRAAGVWG